MSEDQGLEVIPDDDATSSDTLKENWRVKKPSNRIYEKTCFSCGKTTVYEAKQRPEVCPNCGMKYWDKPADERDLFLLQDKYYDSGRDKKFAALLYIKIKDYSANLIKHRAKTTTSFRKSFIEDKSAEAASTLVEQYLKNPNYRVHTSFGMNLNWILNGVLYKDHDNDGEVSLNSMSPHNDNQELQDNLDRAGVACNPEIFVVHAPTVQPSTTCSADLSELIEKIRHSIQQNQSTSHSLGYLLVFHHKLSRQRKGFIEAFYRSFGYDNRDNFEKSELVIMNFLKETR